MDKMGNSFDKTTLVSPLTEGKPAGEKGPNVNNNPVLTPSDPLNYIPSGGKKGK